MKIFIYFLFAFSISFSSCADEETETQSNNATSNNKSTQSTNSNNVNPLTNNRTNSNNRSTSNNLTSSNNQTNSNNRTIEIPTSILEDLNQINGSQVPKIRVSESRELGIGLEGIFEWDATTPKSEANLGTIYDPESSLSTQGEKEGLGVWRRVFEGDANLLWWGAKTGVENRAQNTQAFMNAKNYEGSVGLPPGEYALELVKGLELKWLELKGMGSTIAFENSLEENGLSFMEARLIRGITFDGKDHHFSDPKGGDAKVFMVWVESPKIDIVDSHFKNIVGTDVAQYALGINWNTDSKVESCSFKNISTHTNPFFTGGFTGGVFIHDFSTYRNEKIELRASKHIFLKTHFEDIFTRAQLNSKKVYPDSDGIRSYAFGYPKKYTAKELENLKASEFIIKDCTFKNVMKSGAKIAYSTITIEDSTFEIDKLHYQDPSICEGRWCGNVYVGFRFQSGESTVKMKNLKVQGSKIRFGAIYTGSGNFSVDNLTFKSTYDDASYALLIGGINRTYSKTSVIKNLISNRSLAVLRNAENVHFEKVNNMTNPSDLLFTFIGPLNGESYNIDLLSFKDSSLKGKVEKYNAKVPRVNKITFENTSGIQASSFQELNVGEFVNK